MRSASVKPSLYPPVPFHIIRAFTLFSSLIVGIILAVFIYHLSQQGYKLPWVFLVVRSPPKKTKPKETKKENKTNPSQPAYRRHRSHPDQLHPHNHNSLLLRSLPTPKPDHQHHPPDPLARFPGRAQLEHVPDHPDHLQRNLLGQLNRHLHLSHLQDFLLVHRRRHRLLHRRRHPRYHHPQAPDPTRLLRSHEQQPRRHAGGSQAR